MKKYLSIFLSIVLLCGLMTGCHLETQSETKPQTQPETTPTETQPTEPPIYIAPPEPEETKPKDFNIRLSFTGDMMLAAYKNQTSTDNFNGYAKREKPEYFLEKVRHIFEADDFTIVNLENVFTDQKLSAREKDHSPAFWFYSQTSNVQILTTSSVEGVSLANNHTYDYGQAGRDDTVKTVEDAGLQYGEDEHIMLFEKNGFKIAVICSGLWGSYQADSIVKLIDKAEEYSDYQIVFYHGGTEKRHAPESWREKASRKLVDAGADLVLGNHPHVLQPREVYNGVEILYSLGNFCYGGHSQPENRTMIYQVELTVNYEDLSIADSQSTIIPCYVYTTKYNNYQPAPIEDEEEIAKVLAFMEGKTDSPL